MTKIIDAGKAMFKNLNPMALFQKVAAEMIAEAPKPHGAMLAPTSKHRRVNSLRGQNKRLRREMGKEMLREQRKAYPNTDGTPPKHMHAHARRAHERLVAMEKEAIQ